MRRSSRILGTTCVAVVLTAAAVGCGGESDQEESPDTPSPQGPTGVASTPTPEAGSQGEGSGADPDDITPPGTALTLGETAVVPYQDGTVAITVTEVEEGDRAEFQDAFDDSEGLDPYYIWSTAENLTGEELEFYKAPALAALTEDGTDTGVVLFFGDSVGECQRVELPVDVGEPVESCNVQAAPEGVRVVGAQFDQDDYLDDPITWAP